MFKQLIKMLKKGSLLDQSMAQTGEMLENLEQMFSLSVEYVHGDDHSSAVDEVPRLDKRINVLQQKVRRNIYNHLVLGNNSDLYPSLVLVHMVVDLERMGDYIKNMVDVRRISGKNIDFYERKDELVQLEKNVRELIKEVKNAFDQMDDAQAARIQSKYYDKIQLCESRDKEFLSMDESKPANETAVLVLYYRYMKRIFAHLINVASAIANPFDRIGFHPDDIV